MIDCNANIHQRANPSWIQGLLKESRSTEEQTSKPLCQNADLQDNYPVSSLIERGNMDSDSGRHR